MKILQSVVVKQVLTEKSKKELLKKFHDNIVQLQKECDQLLFEQKKQEKTNNIHKSDIRNQFAAEIQKRQEKIKIVTFQIEQLSKLPLGSEIKEKEVQAIVEVQVGDPWDSTVTQGEIIIRDGVVLEIR